MLVRQRSLSCLGSDTPTLGTRASHIGNSAMARVAYRVDLSARRKEVQSRCQTACDEIETGKCLEISFED